MQMFQSFSKNGNLNLKLTCHKCHTKVQDQFVLLLCDHVICAQCLEDIMADQQVYNQGVYEGLKCVCGLISCFKTGTILQESEVQAKIEPSTVSVNIHHNNRNQRNSTSASMRPSVGLIHSKKTTSTKNVSRILNIQTHLDESLESNSNLNKTNQETLNFIKQSAKLDSLIKSNISKEKNFKRSEQQRERFLLQKSKYPIQSIKKLQQFVQKQRSMKALQYSLMREKKKSKKMANQQSHYEPKYIDSESVADQSITNQNEVPNYQKHRKMKHTYSSKCINSFPAQIQESEYDTVTKSKQYPLSKQLRSQLSYLNITHNKNLEALQRAYKQAKQKINNEYSQLQDNLRDLYMQSIALGRGRSSHVDLGKIMKMRYETFIGIPTQKLIQNIKSSSISFINRQAYQRRVHRFSSPQISKHLPNQALTVYSPQKTYFKMQDDRNLRPKYTITSTLSPLSQLESKLYKKSRNKTNILIEL